MGPGDFLGLTGTDGFVELPREPAIFRRLPGNSLSLVAGQHETAQGPRNRRLERLGKTTLITRLIPVLSGRGLPRWPN